jgi:hypothetical protein
MKRYLIFVGFLAICSAVSIAAQQIPEYSVGYGNWVLNKEDGRLYQNNEETGLAKANFKVKQTGAMIYEFNFRYEGGIEDGLAGFGIHLFVDDITNRPSWGSGKSYLLWLNYDEKPADKRIPAGLSALIYRSNSKSSMTLEEAIDLNQYKYLLSEDNINSTLPIKIYMDPETGEVRMYDPFDEEGTLYYYLYEDPKLIVNNSGWITLRTSSMKASFGLGL